MHLRALYPLATGPCSAPGSRPWPLPQRHRARRRNIPRAVQCHRSGFGSHRPSATATQLDDIAIGNVANATGQPQRRCCGRFRRQCDAYQAIGIGINPQVTGSEAIAVGTAPVGPVTMPSRSAFRQWAGANSTAVGNGAVASTSTTRRSATPRMRAAAAARAGQRREQFRCQFDGGRRRANVSGTNPLVLASTRRSPGPAP